MTQQNTTREYQDIINNLRICLNSKGKSSFNKTEKSIYLIRELKNNKLQNGIKDFEISKQFLKSLYENKTKKQKTDCLSYLLKGIQKEILKQNYYFKDIVFKKFKTQATEFNNFLYSSKNNYIKSFRVGKIYTLKSKKSFDFLVLDSDKIKQIRDNKNDMIRRSLKHYPEFVLKYFFNLTE